MRGIYTPVTDIRRKVFTEVARMAYEVNELSDYEQLMRELPFKIIPGEEKSLRSSIFLERAMISERVRLAMGMSLRPLDESVPASEGLEHSVIADKYYEPPLINVIKFACNACPEKVIKVTAMCQGCLAHPCQEVCPKHAISFRNGKSHIDQSLCVKCGRCVNSCPYSAIVKTERPCAAACGMGAIHSDEHGRAEIDYDKCVSCGMCLVNCPFGAIVDKGQIFQLIQSIKRGDEVVAIVAPAFINQFPGMTPSKLKEAMHQLGFADVAEVAIGADLCTIDEAKAVSFADLPDNPEDAFNSASADARGFAASGGVAQAVVNAIKKMDPDREVKVMSAQGLADCKKMMMMAKAGKYNGYLLEGMACPGGCIAGAGTLADPAKSVAMLNKYKNEATMKVATETPYQDSLDLLHY